MNSCEHCGAPINPYKDKCDYCSCYYNIEYINDIYGEDYEEDVSNYANYIYSNSSSPVNNIIYSILPTLGLIGMVLYYLKR